MARSAHIDAVAHLKAALGLIVQLGEGSERLQSEMRLQVALGPALISMSGYGSNESGKAYHHAVLSPQA
jgi:hypothetical protein